MLIAKRLILVAVVLGGLTGSANAGLTPTLYIGAFNSQEILRYDVTNINNPTAINGPGNPWVSGFSPEGFAGVTGLPGPASNVLFVANINSNTIMTLDADASSNPIINPAFITVAPPNVAANLAGIALSLDGHTLYVAVQNLNEIQAYDTVTGQLLNSATLNGVHDVVVGSDGSVYASGAAANAGVVKFDAALTNPTQFIAPDNIGGMTFDAAGDLWATNRLDNGVLSVQEYSATGTLLRTVTGPSLNRAFGLALGPDGNIYVSNFGTESNGDDSAILSIEETTGALSTYIASPGAGLRPKYPHFSSNFVTYAVVPEPSTLISGGLAGAVGLGLAWRHRRPAAIAA